MDKKWKELTPDEKRQKRYNSWLSADDFQFSSPGAKEAYQQRVTRLGKALRLEQPDRVPVMLPMANFPAYYAGDNLQQVMYDYDKLASAWLKVLDDFDMDTFRGPNLVYAGKVLELLDYKLYKWPGHGLGPEVAAYEFVEGEYMTADEYDDLIDDPSDFAMRTFIPRTIGTLGSFNKLLPFSAVLGRPLGLVNPFMQPAVRAAFEALLEAGRETAKWQEAVRNCNRVALAAGFPTIRGTLTTAPFDVIGDSLRGTRGIMLDMYRQPEKLLQALDRVADMMIKHAIADAAESPDVMVTFPLHKGDDTLMSSKQFETFYWPTLRKVVLALINEGLMVTLFAEGHYGSRLEMVNDLPKGWVTWQFDQTDMGKAKQLLGASACLSGNVPTSLLCTGSPSEVKECCRRLIEVCAPGGGYILTGGAAATEVKAENLHAMMEAAYEYGVY